MLIDSIWGGLAILILDWTRIFDATLGIGVVAGLPVYVLDLWSRKKVVVFLPALFVLRWIVQGFASSPPYFGRPWVGSLLLILAALLLQFSKLRSHGRGRQAAGSPGE